MLLKEVLACYQHPAPDEFHDAPLLGDQILVVEIGRHVLLLLVVVLQEAAMALVVLQQLGAQIGSGHEDLVGEDEVCWRASGREWVERAWAC